MNIFELATLGGAGLGMVYGAYLGFGAAGLPGALGGAVAGAVAGFVLAIAFVAAVVLGLLSLDRATKRWRLRRHFGRYWTEARLSEWRVVKDRLNGGRVVHAKPLVDAFLDIGCGFPARFEHEADDAAAHAIDGEDVEAMVLRFDDEGRVILLTQREQRWLLYEGVAVGYSAGIRGDGIEAYWVITNSAFARLRARLEREPRVDCQVSAAEGAASVSIGADHLVGLRRMRWSQRAG